ncbi:MAG: nitroreductase family protein, partial [Bacillota bacterium]
SCCEMFKVDKDKCIGCEKCITDCFANDIELIDGKANIKNINCFECGHCVAICPTNAVSTDKYDMDEVKEYRKEDFSLDADRLLNFIKFRRTIRQFKDKKVEKEKLKKIIDAARFTPTAGNRQDTSFTVLIDNLDKYRNLTYQSLNRKAEKVLSNSNGESKIHRKYALMLKRMCRDYKKNPESSDNLFFNAPAVIAVSAESPVNAALASGNMELMANALNLGVVFSGFSVTAAEDNQEIKDFLNLKENKELVTVMIIGYPDVEYQRTVPRKKADVEWK